MPEFIVAEHDGVIVGAQGLVPVRMQVGDRRTVAACLVDYAVEPAARHWSLEIKRRATSPPIAHLAFCSTTNATESRLHAALQGAEVDAARKTYILPLRVAPATTWNATRPTAAVLAAKAVGHAVELVFAVRRTVAPRRPPRGTTIRTVHAFDSSYDRLWSSAWRGRVHVVRDAAYLQWRYRRGPFEGAKAIALHRGAEPIGLVIIAPPPAGHDAENAMAITELFDDGTQPGMTRLLLAVACRYTARTGREKLLARSADPSVIQALRQAGFFAQVETSSPVTYRTTDVGLASILAIDSNWHLSLGDGDAWP